MNKVSPTQNTPAMQATRHFTSRYIHHYSPPPSGDSCILHCLENLTYPYICMNVVQYYVKGLWHGCLALILLIVGLEQHQLSDLIHHETWGIIWEWQNYSFVSKKICLPSISVYQSLQIRNMNIGKLVGKQVLKNRNCNLFQSSSSLSILASFCNAVSFVPSSNFLSSYCNVSLIWWQLPVC